MMRRPNIYTISVIFSLCTLFIIAIRTQCTDYTYHYQSKRNTQSTNMNKILDKARTDMKYNLSKYNFSKSGVKDIKDLLMESGGKPIRSLIISAWRSGSTFLGNLVNAVPSTYYHYEPLLMYGIKQMRVPAEGHEAIKMIKRMFTCNFEEMKEYFEFEIKPINQFKHSTRLWDYCVNEDNENGLCYNAEFTSRLCKLFPFQSMKLVRLRLRLVEEILQDKELNVKVILLVRDPRGVLQSRRGHQFCEDSADCSEPSLVCADMISDYVAAGRILRQYPGRLMVIRFEDLALNPNTVTEQIMQHLRLDGTRVLQEFLPTHTNAEVPGFHSTIKISRDVPFKWKSALDFNYVNEIQLACRQAMHLWGYKMAHNQTHMTSKDFNPIRNYVVSAY